ncbi:DapH/DapD/GlmU-related protein [Bacillus sp. OK048]|uniref:DapH/DapD/GlmU-related protein n=1 Tax=Bacillus sp. OK048 TaxID=1882761 RepID=UPI000883BBA5|nr:DapH/DapD/GlmU-related protein [Bacillus sp. OK048]SDN05440.1 serine O-acetyltransferase [Bacillus sp. OK048]
MITEKCSDLMIMKRDELKKILKMEKSSYLKKGVIPQVVVNSKNATIYRFQKYLRCEEYHFNAGDSLYHKVMLLYYKRKKNRLGQKLGFDIPANCFGPGLHIHHVGLVTINGGSKIGDSCTIFGNVCIGVGNSGVPRIGNNCTLGFGSIIIGGITIADNCQIGAGSVVTKSIFESGSKVAGVPAKIIGNVEGRLYESIN